MIHFMHLYVCMCMCVCGGWDSEHDIQLDSEAQRKAGIRARLEHLVGSLEPEVEFGLESRPEEGGLFARAAANLIGAPLDPTAAAAAAQTESSSASAELKHPPSLREDGLMDPGAQERYRNAVLKQFLPKSEFTREEINLARSRRGLPPLQRPRSAAASEPEFDEFGNLLPDPEDSKTLTEFPLLSQTVGRMYWMDPFDIPKTVVFASSVGLVVKTFAELKKRLPVRIKVAMLHQKMPEAKRMAVS